MFPVIIDAACLVG